MDENSTTTGMGEIVEPDVSTNGATPRTWEDVKALDDIGTETVKVKAWKNLELEVRSMTGTERASILQRAVDQEDGTLDFGKLYPEIIVATCYKPETGEKFFPADAKAWLNDKSSAALEQLASVGLRLSGIDKEAKEKASATFPG